MKEMNKTKEYIAKVLYRRAKAWQLSEMRKRMPSDKQGAELVVGGKKYVAFVRRLTPTECARLQTVPDDYEFVTSEAKTYHGLGNGWNIETIKHIFQFIPEDKKKDLKVLSLFDGISGGQMALNGVGARISTYLASEIDKDAIVNTMHNFPKTVQLGSVTDINVDELVGKYGVPDMLIGGSPCQSFSMSGKRKGMQTTEGENVYTLDRYLQLKSEGFEFEGQSYLFWEYMRILTELRKYNPSILFFLENVEMENKWERCLSHAIGVQGVHINSALVSAQSRKRIYWSNIKTKTLPDTRLFPEEDDDNPFAIPLVITDIPQPKDRNIMVADIIQDYVDGKYYMKDAALKKMVDKTDTSKITDYFKTPQLSISEVVEFLDNNPEYSSMTDGEKLDMAKLGYDLEQERLKALQHETTTEFFNA